MCSVSWQTAVIIQHSRSLLFGVSLNCWFNPDTGVFSLFCFMNWYISHAAFTWWVHVSLSLSGPFSLHSSMEWPGDLPEDPSCVGLLAPGVSSEMDSEQFLKDTKEKLNPNANRSVREAKASTWMTLFFEFYMSPNHFHCAFITFRIETFKIDDARLKWITVLADSKASHYFLCTSGEWRGAEHII